MVFGLVWFNWLSFWLGYWFGLIGLVFGLDIGLVWLLAWLVLIGFAKNSIFFWILLVVTNGHKNP